MDTRGFFDAAHDLAAALQNALDAYGDAMDYETLSEGITALEAYNALITQTKRIK